MKLACPVLCLASHSIYEHPYIVRVQRAGRNCEHTRCSIFFYTYNTEKDYSHWMGPNRGCGALEYKTCVNNRRGPEADVLGSPIDGEEHSMRLPYNTTVRILVYFGFMAPPCDAMGLPWACSGTSLVHPTAMPSLDCHGTATILPWRGKVMAL